MKKQALSFVMLLAVCAVAVFAYLPSVNVLAMTGGTGGSGTASYSGSLTASKVDENGDPLGGAEFYVEAKTWSQEAAARGIGPDIPVYEGSRTLGSVSITEITQHWVDEFGGQFFSYESENRCKGAFSGALRWRAAFARRRRVCRNRVSRHSGGTGPAGITSRTTGVCRNRVWYHGICRICVPYHTFCRNRVSYQAQVAIPAEIVPQVAISTESVVRDEIPAGDQ